MSVTCLTVQLGSFGVGCFQGHLLSLGSLGQFARGSASSLRRGDLGGLPSVLAGRGARRAAHRVADRLRRVRAHGLDVGDVEVGGVAASPAAPPAASFAPRAAGVSSRLCKPHGDTAQWLGLYRNVHRLQTYSYSVLK